MRRCLILSCSKTKLNDPKPLPAVQRYDGPPFRVYRLFLKNGSSLLKNVDLYVLSAQYGLIAGDTPVDDYDQRMTSTRAVEINPQVLRQMTTILQRDYSDIFILLSKVYLYALNGYETLNSQATIRVTRSAEGKRLRELRHWLYQEEVTQPMPERSIKVTGRATLHGKIIERNQVEIHRIAQDALQHGIGTPYNYKEWYCIINGQKVSPKWLVRLLSGLSVSEFQASDARRVLAQLGIEIEHV
jgi:hypothetical protein